MKKFQLILALCMTCLPAFAQQGVDMADTMRSEGKIYVVVGVMAIVFTVVLVYLVLLDRKIGRLERKIRNRAGT